MITQENWLASLQSVVRQAKNVKINTDRIEPSLSKITIQSHGSWSDQSSLNYNCYNTEELLRYFIIRESFNFCFWGSTPKWKIQYDNNWYSGSYGMIYALEKARLAGKNLADLDLAEQLSFDDFKEIFTGTADIPLAEERYQILQELLQEFRQAGDLQKLFNVETDIQLLNRIIESFSNFRDTDHYQNEEVYFYKRAILLVTDLVSHMDFIKQRVQHCDNMLGCADYKAPQSLRELGILEYTPELANKIDKHVELPEGSTEEIEIRAATLVAIEMIKSAFIKQGVNASSVQIDNALWLLSKQPNFVTKPYHHTKTTNY